jgi:hypothetical protein
MRDDHAKAVERSIQPPSSVLNMPSSTRQPPGTLASEVVDAGRDAHAKVNPKQTIQENFIF